MTATMIAQGGGRGRMQRQRATSTGGRDRDRDGDGDAEDNNNRVWQWWQDDAKLMHDVNRQRGQGQEQGWGRLQRLRVVVAAVGCDVNVNA